MKELESFTIDSKCLFCDATLIGDTTKKYSSGDLIKCMNCGENNDYDSLIDIASTEGLEVVSKQVNEHFEKLVKDMFKD